MAGEFMFATCVRSTALQFLRTALERDVQDSADDAGPLLDLVEADQVRVADPSMHGNAQVIPGTNWDEDLRDLATAAARRVQEK